MTFFHAKFRAWKKSRYIILHVGTSVHYFFFTYEIVSHVRKGLSTSKTCIFYNQSCGCVKRESTRCVLEGSYVKMNHRLRPNYSHLFKTFLNCFPLSLACRIFANIFKIYSVFFNRRCNIIFVWKSVIEYDLYFDLDLLKSLWMFYRLLEPCKALIPKKPAKKQSLTFWGFFRQSDNPTSTTWHRLTHKHIPLHFLKCERKSELKDKENIWTFSRMQVFPPGIY